MKLTIVVPDGIVGIDGEFRELDLSELPPNIHAVQWASVSGHIEFNDGTPNEIINSIDMFSDLVAAWNALTPAPPAPPTLAELKALKNTEINQARLTANQTTFTYQAKQIACDPLSRGDIDGVNGYVATRGALPPNWVGGWKAVDNSIVLIQTVDAWNSFFDSMIAQGQANFAKSEGLKAQLAAATTAEQVAAITW
jgi:hypothetical protein